MRVIIAGGRDLPAGSSSFAFPVLDALEEEDTVLLRKPKYAEASHFESIIAAYCHYRNVPFRFYEPNPTEETPGRASVFVRDIDMVADADRMVLFLSRAAALAGDSGTYHLLEKGIDAGIRIDAFTIGYENMRLHIERLGSQ